jgi:hypothetical protein
MRSDRNLKQPVLVPRSPAVVPLANNVVILEQAKEVNEEL